MLHKCVKGYTATRGYSGKASDAVIVTESIHSLLTVLNTFCEIRYIIINIVLTRSFVSGHTRCVYRCCSF